MSSIIFKKDYVNLCKCIQLLRCIQSISFSLLKTTFIPFCHNYIYLQVSALEVIERVNLSLGKEIKATNVKQD